MALGDLGLVKSRKKTTNFVKKKRRVFKLHNKLKKPYKPKITAGKIPSDRKQKSMVSRTKSVVKKASTAAVSKSKTTNSSRIRSSVVKR